MNLYNISIQYDKYYIMKKRIITVATEIKGTTVIQ